MTLVELTKQEVLETAKGISNHYHTIIKDYNYSVNRVVNEVEDPYTISSEIISGMTVTFMNDIVLTWNRDRGYTLYNYYGNINNRSIIKQEQEGHNLLNWLYYGGYNNQ